MNIVKDGHGEGFKRCIHEAMKLLAFTMATYHAAKYAEERKTKSMLYAIGYGLATWFEHSNAQSHVEPPRDANRKPQVSHSGDPRWQSRTQWETEP